MHLPDAILSGPVTLACGALGAGALACCLYGMRKQEGDRATLTTGMVAAFLFAAQMVNFPTPVGASGHLIGGVLAGVILGPWAGAVAVGAVLLVQALLFADGGVTALGANFVNMGLINTCLGYGIYREVRRLAGGGRRGTLIGAIVAAWLAVVLASAACAIELAASGRMATLVPILGMMTLIHALIGLGEALITGLVLQSILATRPDLIPDPDATQATAARRVGRFSLAGVAVALAVAVFLAPFAWSEPDGLEYVSKRLSIESSSSANAKPVATAVMPEYEFWLPGVHSLKVATATAGAVGVVVVFGLALALGSGVSGRHATETTVP